MNMHTPTPWSVDIDDGGHIQVWANIGLSDEVEYSIVADCTEDETIPYEQAIANATLIAAAPDLLKALKHARSQMQHPDQMIDEAIAKAETIVDERLRASLALGVAQ